MTALHYRDHKDLSVNIAIYETHYVKLVQDPNTHEWLSIERESYDQEDMKSEYSVLTWAMSDEFKEGRLQKIEVGNTSFATKGTLIPGAQQLFGIKTQMQFGKLWLTTVFASQRSQRQSTAFKGGSSPMPFEIKADEYEENRHFLLAQRPFWKQGWSIFVHWVS